VPKREVVGPKWLMLTPEVEDELGREEAGPNAANLGIETAAHPRQLPRPVRAVTVNRAVSPFVLATDEDGDIGMSDLDQVILARSEQQSEAASEDENESVEVLNMKRNGLDTQGSRTPSAQLEDQYERTQRSGAPSPEPGVAGGEPYGTSDALCKTLVSETDADVHTAVVQLPAMDTPHAGSQESNTPRAGEAAEKSVFEGDGKIEGISIAIHLLGQDDLVFDVEVVGVVKRG
jgi:hypothetical protein